MNTSESGGIGFVGVLQIVFIVLKLVKVINWSWFIVLLPFEIGVAAVILLILLAIWGNK